jgi:hypothetical protein
VDAKWEGPPWQKLGQTYDQYIESNPGLRCQAFLGKRHGRQCKRLAMRGARYCPRHGGRPGRRRVQSKVPGFYSRYLGKTLSQALDASADRMPGELLQAYEELALIRESVGPAILMYDAALQSDKLDLQMSAGAVMREALGEVVRTCQAIAQMEGAAKDRVSVVALRTIVDQIVRVAYDVFSDPEIDAVVGQRLAERFEEQVRNRVRLPREGGGGTTVTPDQDVAEMDDSVPRIGDT